MNKTPVSPEAPLSSVVAHGSHALVPVVDGLRALVEHKLQPHSRLFAGLSIALEDNRVLLKGELDCFAHKALLIGVLRQETKKRALELDASGVTVPERKQQ